MRDIDIVTDTELINDDVEIENTSNVESIELEIDSYDDGEIDDSLSSSTEFEDTSTLSRDEEYQLFTRYRNGDKSIKDTLIAHNINLVKKVASKYAVACKSLEFNDLVNEGVIGLMTAIDRFDPELGYKFSTYAVNWIRQAIFRAIQNTDASIRVPVHALEKDYIINKKIQQIENKKGIELTEAEKFNLYVQEYGMDEALKIQNVISAKNPVYLDKLAKDRDDDGDTSIGDLVLTSYDSVDSIVENKELYNELFKAMKECLKDKELNVLMLRFGFSSDNTPRTLEEVGEIYGVTRERIRQIEARALRKLRPRLKKAGIKKEDYM